VKGAMMKTDLISTIDIEARPIPKTRAVSITQIIRAVSAASDGAVTVPEVADAINNKDIYDGDSMMIYRGDGYGLADPLCNRTIEGAGYNKRVDTITELFNVYFWDNPDATISKIHVDDLLVLKEDGAEIFSRLWAFFFPGKEALALDELLNTNPPTVAHFRDAKIGPPLIIGDTFARLKRAIEAFPARYPDHGTKPPKLNDDVRQWLRDSKIAENEREAHVFGAIIAEHFGISSDTRKTA